MKNKGNTTKKKVSKRGLTPKLRFPEFRDAGTWKENLLEDMLTLIVREIKKPTEPYTGLGIRSHGKGTFLKNFENPGKNSMEYLYEVKCGDLIVSITFAWEGAIAIAKQTDNGALVSHRFPTYIFKSGRVIPAFFQYKLVDKQFIYNLGIISPGGAGRNRVLNKNDFLKLTVSLPDIAEQQKIADCLSFLDELIAVQAKKIEALKDHKKGLIQILFPVDGETQPKLRFPEFRGAKRWKKKILADLCYMQAGKFIPALEIYEKCEDLYPCYGGNGLRGFTKSYTHTGKYPLIGRQGALCGNINLGTGSFYATEHALVVTARENIHVDWLFYQLSRLNLNQYATGQAQPGLSVDLLERVVSVTPVEQEEQQRIADCLSSIDGLIAAQAQKLEVLKKHKIGLMQQLFPNVNEV